MPPLPLTAASSVPSFVLVSPVPSADNVIVLRARQLRRSRSDSALVVARDTFERSIGRPCRAPWFEDAAFQKLLDRETHSVEDRGNAVDLLVDGQRSFPRRYANIANADVILAKAYAWVDDDEGRRYVSALADRARAGAKVFVQFDVKRCLAPTQLVGAYLGISSTIPPLLQPLLEAGAVLIPNNTPKNLRNLVMVRDHEKYLMTWRAGEPVKLIMGGANVGAKWAYGGTPGMSVNSLGGKAGLRDTDIEIAGPAVERAVDEFYRDTADHDAAKLPALRDALARIDRSPRHAAFPKLTGVPSSVRFVANRTSSGAAEQNIVRLYELMLDAVPKGDTVRIANAFFLPLGPLSDALIRTAKRGVHIEVLVNAPDAPELDSRLTAFAAQSFYRDLLAACPPGSVSIFEWHGTQELGYSGTHQKVASFGKHGPFIVGSSNLDGQSMNFNTEGVVLIFDTTARAACDAMLDRDFRMPGVREVTLESLRAQPTVEKISQWVVFHVFGQWL